MKNKIISIVLVLFTLTIIGACNNTENMVTDPTAAKNGDKVQLSYSMRLDDGTVLFDTADSGAPAEITIGSGSLLPAVEKAIIGMKVGDKKTIKVSSKDAYGPYRKDLIIVVPRIQIPQDQEPQVGMQLQKQNDDGSVTTAKIIGVTDKTVTLDTNMPLAGKDLIYDIELLKIL
jgi:peptidylprolyl isomerase